MKGPLVKDEKQTTPSVVIISEDGLGEVFPLSEGNNVLGSGITRTSTFLTAGSTLFTPRWYARETFA